MTEQNENVPNDLIGDDHDDVVEEVNVNDNNNNDIDMEEEEAEDDDDEENVVVNVNSDNNIDMDVDDENVDVDEEDYEDDANWDSDHPLHLAIRRNEAEDVILQLIDLHPDVVKEIDISRGEYLLHKACRFVYSENVIMKLLDIFPIAITQQNNREAVQQHNNKGRHPLHIACRSDKSDIVVLNLIKVFPEVAFIKPTKIDTKAWSHGSALSIAINGGQSEKVIRKLIKLNPLALCEHHCDGDYPIHSAIWTRRSNALIGLMMDIDPLTMYRGNLYGTTPLHCAFNCYSYELMEYMIQKSNISINYKTPTGGYAALHFAYWHSGRDYDAIHVEAVLRYPDIDVNIRDNRNETPLHKAALYHTEIIAFEKLLEYPFIDINSKNNDGKTPLDIIQEKIKVIRTTIPSDDDSDAIRKLQLYNNIEKLFEEFATKRRWNAYCYFLNIP